MGSKQILQQDCSYPVATNFRHCPPSTRLDRIIKRRSCTPQSSIRRAKLSKIMEKQSSRATRPGCRFGPMITKQAWREQNWEKKKEDGTTTPTTKPLCRKEQSEETYLGNTSIKITFAVATGGTRAKMKAKVIATASLHDAPAFALKATAFNAMELNQSTFLGSGSFSFGGLM